METLKTISDASGPRRIKAFVFSLFSSQNDRVPKDFKVSIMSERQDLGYFTMNRKSSVNAVKERGCCGKTRSDSEGRGCR